MAPFQSEAQRRFLYSEEPEVAKEFEEKTPKPKTPRADRTNNKREAMNRYLNRSE